MTIPRFISDSIGSLDDRVRLMVGKDEILIAESWDVHESILSQPATWQIKMGHGSVAAALLARYPPRTPFQLYIGGALQASGVTDARAAEQPEGGAVEITLRGRDALAPMHDTYVKEQESFKDETYAGLVKRALAKCGLDPTKLVATNDANRKVKAGVPIVGGLTVQTADEILSESPSGGGNIGIVSHEVQAKLNETWLGFCRRHLDRAGLFLWAAADGSFVLTRLDGLQAPSYRLVRRRGVPTYGANVLSMSFSDDVAHRHSEAVIYGRGGGKKAGRAKSKGGFTDAEMIAYGYDQAIVYRDANVSSGAEAVFFAHRRLAEERREGWRLEYTIAGHRLPWIKDASATMAVVTTDTTIDVDDAELGLKGVFYIEGVERSRSPQTTTKIRLMRVTDLIFGDTGDEDGNPAGGSGDSGAGGGSVNTPPQAPPDDGPPDEPTPTPDAPPEENSSHE